MKHNPNPLKNKQLVREKVIKRVDRLSNLLPKIPIYDMDGSRFCGHNHLNSKALRINRRLWDITTPKRHGFMVI